MTQAFKEARKAGADWSSPNTSSSMEALDKDLHQQKTYQLLEEVAHSDLAVPLLHLGAEVVVKLLVDLVDVLDLIEDGLDLLDGEHRLGGCGCGL